MPDREEVMRIKYEAAVTADWLRKCVEDDKVADHCHKCPFDNGTHNCMDYLHTTAADLLGKLAHLIK